MSVAKLAEFDQLDARMRELVTPMREHWKSLSAAERLDLVEELLGTFDRELVAIVIGVACVEE